jgi:acetyl esterase/lipase
MKPLNLLYLISLFTVSTTLMAAPTLPGYVDGIEVLKVVKTQNQIDEITGVVYAQNFTARSVTPLHMNLLIPRNSHPKPAILYFPGGGFTSAEYQKFYEMRSALAKAGFVVAAVEYRVIPNTYPAPVIDAKAAVRYLREHAKQFGIDPSRVGVLGDSAGGWLAQMVALTGADQALDTGDNLGQSSAIQAAVSIYGISNLLSIGEGFSEQVQKVHNSPAVTEALLLNGPAFREFAGAAITADPQKALNASPMGHLDGKKPPVLLMAGSY